MPAPATIRIEIDVEGIADLLEPSRRFYSAMFRAEAELADLLPRGATDYLARAARALDEMTKVLSDSMLAADVVERNARRAQIGQPPVGGEELDALRENYARNRPRLADQISEQVEADVREKVDSIIREGGGPAEARAASRDIREGGSADAFARSQHETETANAQNASRMTEAEMSLPGDERDSDIVGLRYVTVGDARVRPNHAALHGLEMATTDPRWEVYAPPNGWNCRCVLAFVTRGAAKRAGRLQEDGSFRSDTPASDGGPDDSTWATSPVASVSAL